MRVSTNTPSASLAGFEQQHQVRVHALMALQIFSSLEMHMQQLRK
jgi:hypothetical protein